MSVQTEGRIALFVIAAIGITANSLVVWGVVIIARNGGWTKATQRPAALGLLLAGALLGLVFVGIVTWLAGLKMGPWPH
jgi:hypothetical protein